MSYGYPTVRTIRHTSDQPYLCVSHRAEKEWVQPLRLFSGLILAPYLYKISQRQSDARDQQVLYATSIGMAAWSLMVWYNANKQMEMQ